MASSLTLQSLRGVVVALPEGTSVQCFHVFPGYNTDITHTTLTQPTVSSGWVLSQLLKCCTHTATAFFTCHLPPRPYLSLTLLFGFFILLLRDLHINSSTRVLAHNLTEKHKIKTNRWKMYQQMLVFFHSTFLESWKDPISQIKQ